MRSQVCACRVFYNGIESSEKQHLFRIETFCNIINTLTDTFDQFDAFLLNKITELKKTADPKMYSSV